MLIWFKICLQNYKTFPIFAKKFITMIKEYKTDDLTIIWQPDKCIHAGVCVYQLPKVYNVKERPWCKPQNATTEELIAQIKLCPSGALTYKLNK